MKRLALILALLLVFPIVQAFEPGSVAYILKYPPAYEQKPVDVLESMGFTVDFINSANAAYTDYDTYDFILVADDRFTNPEAIPVNEQKAILFNTRNMDDWHWASVVSYTEHNVPMEIYNAQPSHIIADGIAEGLVQVYDRCCYQNSNGIPVDYLSRLYRSPFLDSIFSEEDNVRDAVIATAVPGTQLKDNAVSNTKTVFFGIPETEYWTPISEQLFENSVTWLLTDTTPPALSNVEVVDIGETTARVTWDTDLLSDSTVDYGPGNMTDSGLVTSHSITLTGLAPLTTYSFNVTSCNADGFCATLGPDTFTTLDTTPPVILNVELTALSDTTAEITAQANEPTTAILSYGLAVDSLNQEVSDPALSTAHLLELTGLDDRTTYYYKVEVCDSSDNCETSSIDQFTTLDFTAPGAPLNLIASVVNSNNHIVLQWNPPSDEDIAGYNIYAGSTPDSIDVINEIANTSGTSWEDAAASGFSQRFYIVRAEDASSNEEQNENIVGKFDIQLIEGPNLVSLPLQPFDGSIDSVMHQTTGFAPVSEVLSLQADGSYSSAKFSAGSWDNPTELHTGIGYFFRSNRAYTFSLVGIPVTAQQSIPINEGNNMVGWTSLEPSTLIEALPADGLVTEVFTHDAPDTYLSATYYASQAPDYWWYCSSEFGFEPGKGYVLKSSQDFDWEYQP